jgi:hypothetical protein
MAANTDLIVTGLDFDTIRLNLRSYIASKPEFTDYDFNDSALGTLLDLLAYNTYYNAFYTNMAANEGFLDTAQLYDSVVSRAKSLGYTPTSARGASANVQLIFTSSIANSTFRSIRVPKDTRFSTTVNGATYTFVAPQTYTITANSTNGFADFIKITEGLPLTHRFVYNRTSNTAFVLPNDNVDTNSITVSVTTGGNNQTYVRGENILTTNSSSQVYFIDADKEQRYKVYFGDGVIGAQPATSSVIAISYRVCNGIAPNGANSFSLVNSTIDGQSGITIVPIGRASGGAEIEDIESIRFNAPLSYQTQNRCVTTQDYERILLRENPDIQAVRTWGGEENDPPIYGKVYISAKPKNSTLLSSTRKEEIKINLRKYNVQSIDVEIVDPTYIYVIPSLNVRYNSTRTTLTPGELASSIANRIISFESEYLSRFNQNFRYSKFLEYIDDTNNSIETSTAIIRLRKTFNPVLTSADSYTIKFNNAIQRLGTKELISGVSRHPGYGSLTSSSFVYEGYNCYLDDNGFGTVRIYYRSGVGRLGRVYVNYDAGTVDYDTGTVVLTNFRPTSYSGESISIIVAPLQPNIIPVRNQIILMSQSEINIIDDITGRTLTSVSSVETIGQTATILTPSGRLYNF